MVGIELLNEPANWDLDFDTLEQFYRDGYGQVRAVSDSVVVIHDAFLEPSNWNNILATDDNNAYGGLFSPGPILKAQYTNNP